MQITGLELVLIILSTAMITGVATFIATCLAILKIGKRLALLPEIPEDDPLNFPDREQ